MELNASEIKKIVCEVMEQYGKTGPSTECSCGALIPVEASARHVHLNIDVVETLFGKGYRLTKKRELSQPGEFLSSERVRLISPKGEIQNVAVLGPERKAVQVELSLTDTKLLGLSAPINLSGNLSGAASIYIASDKVIMEAPQSVIVAKAHIHMTDEDARNYGVLDGESVRVKTEGTRPVTFDDVVVRVNKNFALAMHIDFDEANACALECKMKGKIQKK